ncbi:MAG: hypothetical protein Kow0063_42070 [Anaerolineae bacterium]
MLRKNLFSAGQIQAILEDFRNAGLEPDEVAMLAYVEKVIHHAHHITGEDIDELRCYGFSDAEILDITLAAAARSFFAKVLDALGAEPDEVYLELEDGLRQALSVGRPFGQEDHR